MGSNCSNELYPDPFLTDYVLASLGPKCLQSSVARTTLTIYSTILFFGVVGNVSAISVIVRSKGNVSVVSYYLLSLSVSDLLSLLLGLPFELYNSMTTLYPYRMPEFMCKTRGYISEATTYASVLTVLAFSIERWLAICYPFKLIKTSPNRVVKTLVGIWTLSLLTASPMAHYVKINRINIFNYSSESEFVLPNGDILGTDLCAMDIYDVVSQKVLIHTSFWIFFIIPMVIMLILFIHIETMIYTGSSSTMLRMHSNRYSSGKAKISYSRNRVYSSNTNNTPQSRTKKGVTRMLFTVVLVFFVCWLPFHIQRLMIMHVSSWASKFVQDLFNTIYYISGYFYYANSAINPCVYTAFNRRIRRMFFGMLCKTKSRRRLRTAPTRHHSFGSSLNTYMDQETQLVRAVSAEAETSRGHVFRQQTV